MGYWSKLNYDILGEIVLKLSTIEDFVYFSVVCRSWNCASSMVKQRWKPSMPCLLLAENNRENPNFLREVISLDNDDNKCYQLTLPETFEARCWGSDCGWIVTIELNRQIHLFNPFTKARLQLPPQTTLPYQQLPLDDAIEDAICKRQASIRKAIVIKSDEPENEQDLLVLAIHTNWKRFLAFSRPGDQNWTKIHPPWPTEEERTPHYIVPFSHRAVDLVCRDGLVLILYEDASVGYVDISDLVKIPNSQQPVKAKEFLPSPESLKSRLTKYLLEMYLVESFGNLFMVHRDKTDIWVPDSKIDKDIGYETVGFEVFELNSETKQWEEVEDLGNVALFLGDNHSMSVNALECRNCKPNCIYFTDDYAEQWELPAKFGGHDMGVFDVKNGEIHRFYEGDHVHSNVCTPFWFMPQF
ncbi:hypothetical protein RND81_05G175400 [Saponaria officinalis]|uniref:DUF295 domain-containing protein n=1 Tax=Saponaria officinalis TaxID=3572 RepID=A0AAW1KU48_SAPOF